MLLVRAGLAVFCLACVKSERLPSEAILVGPAMMVAGVAMKEINRRESRGQRWQPLRGQPRNVPEPGWCQAGP